MVDLPSSDTMPGAALSIKFSGTPRHSIDLYLGGSLAEAPSQQAKGSWELVTRLEPVTSGELYVRVCIPGWAAGAHTGLLFWVTNRGDCRNQVDFTMTEASLGSSTWCLSD